nr:hypothetical protein [Tanacetum cinerariifolium]
MIVQAGCEKTVSLFETKGVGPVGKFKEVEVDANNKSEKESDTEGDYTVDSDSKDLYYDPKHDDVFDDDKHIVKDVHVNINNFIFIVDPKHYTSIGGVDVQDDDLDVIDYDSNGSDLDDGIDFERRMQLRELKRTGKQKKTRIPINKNIFSQTKGSPAIRENINSGKQNILGKDKIVEGKGKKVNKLKKVDKNSCHWTMLVTYTKGYRWEVRTLIEDHTCIQLRGIKACTSRFLADHVIKSLVTNLDIPDLGIEANFNYTFISDRQKGFIQAIASVFPSVEHMYGVRHIHENMKSQFKRGVYKEMLWNAATTTSKGEFKKRMGRARCDLIINNICKVFNRQLVDDRDQPIITYLEYIREYLMKRIVVVQKVIAKTVGPLTPYYVVNIDRIVCSCRKWELTGIPCKHVVAAIYNMSENLVGVGIPKQWVYAAYRLETWAHVYSFKVNPCNKRDMWPVVESRTVTIPPLYKPPNWQATKEDK